MQDRMIKEALLAYKWSKELGAYKQGGFRCKSNHYPRRRAAIYCEARHMLDHKAMPRGYDRE